MKRKEPLIIKYKDLLNFLSKLPTKKKIQVISGFKKEHIQCLSEIFKNFLNRKLTDDIRIIKRLKKYKPDIREVARKKTSLKKKLRLLTSKRGGNILALLLPLAVNLISKFLP